MNYADLLDQIATVAQDEIPTALGALAEADARLRLRLLASPAPAGAVEDRLLTVADVARRLATPVNYVYRHADTWPFTRRVGRHLRFSEQGLSEWLAEPL